MPTSVERQRLAEAIEAANAAQKLLDEARRAQHNAQTRWSDANGRVGAFTAQIEEAEDAPTSSDKFVAELAGGLAVVVESPVDELRKQRDKAQSESTVWRAACVTSEEAIEARMTALDLARSRVDEAARRVADAELGVSALIARAEAARQATLVATAELLSAMKMLPQSSMRRHEIESFLQRGWCSPNSIERAAGGERLSEWFDKLKADAGAKMN